MKLRGFGLGTAALLLLVSLCDALRDTGYGDPSYWRYHIPKWIALYSPLLYILWHRWPLWIERTRINSTGYRVFRWRSAVMWVLLAVLGSLAWKAGAILGGQPGWGGMGGVF